MAALLIRLNFLLARRSLKKSPWQVVGLVIGILYALGLGAGLLIGMAALGMTDLSIHRDVPVLAFGLITLMWVLMSLLFFGVDQTLDPARFSLLPLRAKDLIPGLMVIGLLGLGSLACLIGTVGLVIGWRGQPLVAVVALLGGLLGTMIGMLGARVLTTAFSSALSSRRFKDLAAVLLFLVIMGFSIGMQFVSRGASNSTPEAMLAMVHQGAKILAWTPFGWAWALPGDAAVGAWGPFALRLILSLALIAVLAWAWGHFLERALTSPLETGSGAGRVKANSWIDRVFPATPAGAIAARTTRYLRRDSRHLIGLISLIVMPILMIAPTFTGSGDREPNMADTLTMVAFAPCFSAAFIGMSFMAELSYDGSAISTHMLSGIRGRDDRLGRAMGALIILGPLMLVMLVVGMVVSRRLDLLPAILGLTVALAGGGLGAGLVMDTFVNYPYPPPGANPFAKNNGGGFMGFVGFLLLLLVSAVVATPSLAGLVWYLTSRNVLGLWLALGAGVVLGPLVAWGLIVAAGRALDGRWPEVLRNVTAEKA